MISQQIFGIALVLSMHMCLGKAAQRIYSRHQDSKRDRSNQATTPTTAFPVNPYVFSAEDLNILQDASSVQQAMSIVSYEPRKIDAMKSESSNVHAIIEKNVKPSYVNTQQPVERRRSKLLQNKQSKATSTDEYKTLSTGKPASVESVKGVTASKFNSRRLTSPSPPQFRSGSDGSSEKFASSTLPSLFPPLLEPATDFRYSKGHQSLDPLPISREKTAQKSSESLTEKIKFPSSRKIYYNTFRAKATTLTENENVSPIPNRFANSRITSDRDSTDRIPRPFTVSNDVEATTQASTFATASPYQRITSAEQTVPTVSRRRQYVRVTEEPGYDESLRSRYDNLPTIYEQVGRHYTVPYSSEIEWTPRPEAPRRHGRTRAPYTPHQQVTPVQSRLDDPQQSVLSEDSSTEKSQEPETARVAQRRAQSSGGRDSVAVRGKALSTQSTLPSEETVQQAQSPTVYRVRKRPQRPTEPSYVASSSREQVRSQPVNVTTKQQLSNPIATTSTPVKAERHRRRPSKPSRSIRPASDHQPTVAVEQAVAQTNVSALRAIPYVDIAPRRRNNIPNIQFEEEVVPPTVSWRRDSAEPTRRYEQVEREDPTSQAYEVNEVLTDSPQHRGASQPIAVYAAQPRARLQQAAETSREQAQPDSRSEEQADDQSQKQNVQQQVTEASSEKEEAQDLAEEADHQHKEEHKPKEEHDEGEEGASGEHHEGGHHEDGEHGEEGYKEFHEHDEGEKGHHDKENHDHSYDEKEGSDKEHSEEAGYHKHHVKGEEGEKSSGYKEKGHHKKGHNTKGEHVIHKKDEFEKKTEFFDEFHDDGEHEKDGGYHEEHDHNKGGHHHKGHKHKGHDEAHHGEKGRHEKGHHHHEKKGHDEHEEHEEHHHDEHKHGKKGGHDHAKHWHHKKGDRRR